MQEALAVTSRVAPTCSPARLQSTMKPEKMKNFSALGCSPTSQYTIALKIKGMGSWVVKSAVIFAIK